MLEIILASNNEGKVKEIQDILKEYKIVSLKEAKIEVKVEEDQETFEKNALKKATEICKLTNKICMADDSGLCIDILNGFPGVKTARFLGENATNEEKNTYLLEKMKDKENRKAKVITCIALAFPDGRNSVHKGTLEGFISNKRRGDNGFGFDEIFELPDGRTLAQLSHKEKNEISSRKIALEKTLIYLNTIQDEMK